MSKKFKNKFLEGEAEKRDTFVEELKKMESKSGNDYMSSMAKEGRCVGDQKTSFSCALYMCLIGSKVIYQGHLRTFCHVKSVALNCVGALKSPLECIENEFTLSFVQTHQGQEIR